MASLRAMLCAHMGRVAPRTSFLQIRVWRFRRRDHLLSTQAMTVAFMTGYWIAS
eukprot:CAMPEP_0117564178 /NCGR_PEP_ID=MMETSP0784-20121206/55891_1 /TAXON_ID=39447 /ORGANISM="" /LENGTH=53 /DNA_ID=CAMNT_0005361877 /DNA_START=12 /DNA_END=170 /DNA_ORIENTATION=+